MNYETIATLNDAHKIYLVQQPKSHKIYVKKILDIYNVSVYRHLLSHPITGIPQIFQIDEEDGTLTVIEEYISGVSLQEVIDAKQVTPEQITRYMGELCDILHELHCQTPPIVHRDIKPSNIIVTPYDHLMLLDFNAAKYTTDENREDTILLGTKGYAAPEQYGFGSSTPQTDIYALGILMKQLVAALPAPTVKFDAVIAKCTQMDPSNRITDVDSLKQELNTGYHPSLVPPGYRTRTPWKMMLSSLIYLFIFWLSLTMEFENATPIQTWVQRIFCLVMMLVIVFFSFNYRNIQRFMPLCSGHSRIVRLIGILLMDVIAVAALFIVMVVIVSSI